MEYRDEKATRLQTIFMFEELEINSAVKNVINKLLSQHTHGRNYRTKEQVLQ